MKIEKTVENDETTWEITNDDGTRVKATWLAESQRLFIYTSGPRWTDKRASLSLPLEMLRELAQEIRQNED